MPPDNDGDTRSFPLGKTCMTAGVANELVIDEVVLALKRHSACDWGDLDPPDKARNERALADGGRLFSIYTSIRGIRFYVITEWDRSVTTVLLPSEY